MKKFKIRIRIPDEYRPTPSLKKRARDFARTAKAGCTYYVVIQLDGPVYSGPAVAEIQFTKKAFVGLMHGSWSPEQLYLMHSGEVYEDRGHSSIRRLQTVTEMSEEAEKGWSRMTSSDDWHEQMIEAAGTTGFRARR